MIKFLLFLSFFVTKGECMNLYESWPNFLYKILSIENWEESQKGHQLIVDPSDNAFIHFSMEDQLERIISKYWKNVDKYVVLRINPEYLVGCLVFEANPGGSVKYYHLYGGFIPMESIAEVKIIK